MSENDKQLIEDFQEGDEFAFISIYNRYKTPLYAFCVKMLGDQELARDVVQETFLRVYENRHRLSNSGAFKAWIFTIARNQCLNQIRRARWQVPFEDEREATSFTQETPVSRLEKSERITLVSHFINELKPEYREVVVLREYQNMSYEDIAAITRSTLSAVKSRLFKARRKLAAMIGPVLEAERAEAGASPAAKK